MAENYFIRPLLTDLYQITMSYAYWKNGHHNDNSVFDCFFRTCPFKGEYAVFAGLDEVLKFVSNFHYTPEEIAYLRQNLDYAEEEFFNWLSELNGSELKIYAIPEGSIVFPRENILRVEGPLALAQLVETTILNLTNFATLVTTNANRILRMAGPGKTLIEFGLRRAQGPDGAMTASRGAYIGGFHGTSNVLAGMKYGVPISGTHAHAYISSYVDFEDLQNRMLDGVDLLSEALKVREEMGWHTNNGELISFTSYAIAHPKKFLALIDTYDTLQSGALNFICVAIPLYKIGYMPLGIRLDSGDLSYLSKEVRKLFIQISEKYNVPFQSLNIVASNDLNEEVIRQLKEDQHEIDTFGIGTNLVTCQSQPALGMVYKLVEIRGHPRIKLSENKSKITLPGKKVIYRLFGQTNEALVDLICLDSDPEPQVGQRILCRHPFDDLKRLHVIPTRIEKLHQLVFDGQIVGAQPSLAEIRDKVANDINTIRPDVVRLLNPTPYKVSVSTGLFQFLNELWLNELPIREVS